MSRAKIMIVGCGPGSPEYLTPLARRTAESAEVLVGARRRLELFPQSRAERIMVTGKIEEALDRVAEHHEQGRRIAVLVTGDPGLCSFAQPVLKRFGCDDCEVIPGVSSVQVAFARLGLDWLDAMIISAHGREPEAEEASLLQAGKIAVLPGGEASWQWIVRTAQQLSASHRLYSCENLTLSDERVRQVEAADLDAAQPASLTIILFIRNDLLG